MNAEHYLSKLEKSPTYGQNLPNSWADYIELLCLASIDNEISQKDVSDRLSGRFKDLKEGADEDLAEMDELEKETEDAIEPSRRAEVSDKWETRVNDYFNVLTLRQNLYGDLYPFEITDDYIRRKDQLIDAHFLYIYLLLCSNLNLFDDVTSGQLSNCFELVSFNAFQGLLPLNARVHLFGKNPYNKNKRYSTGKFWLKLKKLIRDINEERSPHIRRAEFSEHHTADGGLDLVAWIPTGDTLSSSLIYFAQCACTYKFVEKQYSSSSSAWSQLIVFKNPPANSTFIPHCFRRGDGTWIKSSDIADTFLLDRRRILNFYDNTRKIKLSKLPVFEIVQQVVALKETVV